MHQKGRAGTFDRDLVRERLASAACRASLGRHLDFVGARRLFTALVHESERGYSELRFNRLAD
jgi:hypothetical protein